MAILFSAKIQKGGKTTNMYRKVFWLTLFSVVSTFSNECGRIFTFHTGMRQDIILIVFAKHCISAND